MNKRTIDLIRKGLEDNNDKNDLTFNSIGKNGTNIHVAGCTLNELIDLEELNHATKIFHKSLIEGFEKPFIKNITEQFKKGFEDECRRFYKLKYKKDELSTLEHDQLGEQVSKFIDDYIIPQINTKIEEINIEEIITEETDIKFGEFNVFEFIYADGIDKAAETFYKSLVEVSKAEYVSPSISFSNYELEKEMFEFIDDYIIPQINTKIKGITNKKFDEIKGSFETFHKSLARVPKVECAIKCLSFYKRITTNHKISDGIHQYELEMIEFIDDYIIPQINTKIEEIINKKIK